MTLDKRFDIAAEHMQGGRDCNACGTCPFTEAVRRAPAGSNSPSEYVLKQWQGMAEDMAQLRSLLQRQRHSVPVIGYADCTR